MRKISLHDKSLCVAGNSVSRILARLDGSDRTDTCAAAQANTSQLLIGTWIAFLSFLPLHFAARAPGSLRLSSVPPVKAVPERIRPRQTYTPIGDPLADVHACINTTQIQGGRTLRRDEQARRQAFTQALERVSCLRLVAGRAPPRMFAAMQHGMTCLDAHACRMPCESIVPVAAVLSFLKSVV